MWKEKINARTSLPVFPTSAVCPSIVARIAIPFAKFDPLDSSRFSRLSFGFGFIQVYVPSFYTGQIRNASFIESIRNCRAMLL